MHEQAPHAERAGNNDGARAAELLRVESALSLLLRGGVIVSSLIVIVGLVLMYFHHPGYFHRAVAAETVAREMAFPHTVGEVYRGLLAWQGRSVILLGLFVLIATPVLRVALSVLVFLHQRDRMFVVITLIVLSLLLLSFMLGRAGG
jgi:uncharacterized membrane protein